MFLRVSRLVFGASQLLGEGEHLDGMTEEKDHLSPGSLWLGWRWWATSPNLYFSLACNLNLPAQGDSYSNN